MTKTKHVCRPWWPQQVGEKVLAICLDCRKFCEVSSVSVSGLGGTSGRECGGPARRGPVAVAVRQ